MPKKERSLKITRSSGNIYADAGFPNAEEDMLKARVVILLERLISERDLTQAKAANLMGLKQPDVSRLLRGHFDGFSLERLFALVLALGQDVQIKFPKPTDKDEHDEHRRGRLLVMA